MRGGVAAPGVLPAAGALDAPPELVVPPLPSVGGANNFAPEEAEQPPRRLVKSRTTRPVPRAWRNPHASSRPGIPQPSDRGFDGRTREARVYWIYATR